MDFSLSDEQRLLQDSTRRLLSSMYDFSARSRRLKSGRPDPALWARMAEQGLLMLELPESAGGLAADPFTVMTVCQAMGEALCIEPYLESAVIASRVITRLGSDAQRERWLPLLAAGQLLAVLADPVEAEPWPIVEMRGTGQVVHGRVHGVEFADAAQLLLVPARNARGQRGLYAIASASRGLALNAQPTVDGRSRCSLQLDGVAAECLQADCAGELHSLRDYARMAHCADTVGVLERGLRSTVEYVRCRQQFGQPIGRFQALQHRLADLYMRVEEARSMALWAAAHCIQPDAARREEALVSAVWVIARAARELGQQAVQLHGGMGMSDELDISHVFKRLLAFELRLGSGDSLLQCRARALAA